MLAALPVTLPSAGSHHQGRRQGDGVFGISLQGRGALQICFRAVIPTSLGALIHPGDPAPLPGKGSSCIPVWDDRGYFLDQPIAGTATPPPMAPWERARRRWFSGILWVSVSILTLPLIYNVAHDSHSTLGVNFLRSLKELFSSSPRIASWVLVLNLRATSLWRLLGFSLPSRFLWIHDDVSGAGSFKINCSEHYVGLESTYIC